MSERYARQTVLAEVGAAGQARLAAASVAGGRRGRAGLPGAAVSGRRRRRPAHHRRPRHGRGDQPPSPAALRAWPISASPRRTARGAALRRFNPEIAVEAVAERLTPQNAARAASRAADRRRRCCRQLRRHLHPERCLPAAAKPLVSASVIGMTGYAGAFCGGGPSYRARLPDVSIEGGTCATRRRARHGGRGAGRAAGASRACIFFWDCEPSVLGRVVTFDAKRSAFGGFGFAGSPEPEAIGALHRARGGDGRTISWSTCAASRRRRSRRSPVPGVCEVDTVEALLHGTATVAAHCPLLSQRPAGSLAAADSGCASVALPIFGTGGFGLSCPRRVVMTLRTTDKTVLEHHPASSWPRKRSAMPKGNDVGRRARSIGEDQRRALINAGTSLRQRRALRRSSAVIRTQPCDPALDRGELSREESGPRASRGARPAESAKA